MIGKDEYIIKIGNTSIKSPLLKSLEKKLYWESIKSDKECICQTVKIEWIIE